MRYLCLLAFMGVLLSSASAGADENAPGTPVRPAPVQGWEAAYDEHVRTEVQKAPTLLELTASRMTNICPKWGNLSREQRIQFYADLLYAIAKPESDRNRLVMFNETGIIDPKTKKQLIDPVTGYPIISEGLLQLSYADLKSYKAKDGLGCAFDWTKDKEAFLEDLNANAGKKSFKSAHPERTILDPYVQLTCGIHILKVRMQKKPTEDFLAAAGRYWSTMRMTAANNKPNPAFKQVLRELDARKSPCF